MSGVVLNRKLALEHRVQVPDGAGGYSESWQSLGTLWAELKPRSGRIVNGEGGALSAVSHQIIVWAAPEGQSNRPMPGQRFRSGSRLFSIEAVQDVMPRARHLKCLCVEEVAP